MDSDGKERWRIEGYLPKTEFRAHLELGLARVDFMHKHWSEAERRYASIVERYPETFATPEAIYWRVISRYKATNDHNVLVVAAEELSQKYPDSEWAVRASVFTH